MRLLLGALLSFGLFSTQSLAQFPVDDDIAELHEQINYLETLKSFFSKNDCSLSEDSNTILLRPDWLRSEGLVIGIDASFAGNVFSYHQAPKPDQFKNIIEFTSLRPSVSPTLIRIYGGFGADLSETITFVFSKPRPISPGGTGMIYSMHYLDLPVPKNGEQVAAEITSNAGTVYKIFCN